MKIVVASGKGGTGKTTVATSLACVAASAGRTAAYVDCDVEEPNGHLFLRPVIDTRRVVGRCVPRVDAEACTRCGECGRICRFSAIVCIGEEVLVFPELCHGCGGCRLVCPTGAIAEESRRIGQLEVGRAGGVAFIHGVLDVGQAMSPPLIRAVKAAVSAADVVVIDAAPGTSCPVVESVRGSDFVLLVTEPTPFGLNDLKLAVEMVRAMDLPFGLVINRADLGDGETRAYCLDQDVEILAEIPDDRRIAEAYCRGEVICDALPEYRPAFDELLRRITDGRPAAATAATEEAAP